MEEEDSRGGSVSQLDPETTSASRPASRLSQLDVDDNCDDDDGRSQLLQPPPPDLRR